MGSRGVTDVHGHLLGVQPLPALDEIFTEVRREDHRRRVMLGATVAVQFDASALAVNHCSLNHSPNASKNHTWCDHCNKAYHTRETCWLIHGKPEDFVPNRLKKKGVTPHSVQRVSSQSAPPGVVNLTSSQVEQLCNLLSQSTVKSKAAPGASPSTPAPNVSLMARQGSSEPSVAHMLNSGKQWIVDSGATDHMTGNSQFFLSYSPSSGQQKVQMANVNFSTVAGKGTVRLSPALLLKDVLHVPKLTYNLISVCKLTTDLPCGVNFSKTACVFQDLRTGKRIGSARSSNGLYYLSVSSPTNNVSFPMCLSTVSAEKQ